MNHKFLQKEDGFDFDKLEYVVRNMVRFMDDVGTNNQFPSPKFEQWYTDNRPIGIGIMGLADLFLRYGLQYGTWASLEFLDCIMHDIYITAHDESAKLGRELGVPKNCKVLPEPRRNITLLSIAPTGSIAIIADCSHGIEPIFSPAYNRVDERGQQYLFVHPKANEDYFVSAVGNKQPSWKEQIDLVSTCQLWVDSGVSKTINLPNSATVQDVKDAFAYAWKSGLKGITVYRDGSRSFQVLNNVPDENDSSECPSGVCNL